MTKIITSENKIIFDGHARTKEECETISLACEELSKSDKFRTVKYGSGYAEFEKVGKTDALKFPPTGWAITFDSHIQSVTNETYGTTSTTSGSWGIGENSDSDFSVVLDDGYIIDTVVTDRGTVANLTSNTFSIINTASDQVSLVSQITITSKLATPTISFKHRFKNDTLIGTGTYKFRRYSVQEPTPSVPTDCIMFTGETSDFTLSVGSNGAKEWNGTVWYSTDKSNWNVWDGSAVTSSNKKLYLRGKNNTKFYTSKGAKLLLSARASCVGNVQTLLDYETPPTKYSAYRCFQYMFYGCTNLIKAPELPATTLANYCYDGMFYGCTSLTQAPELPATTLAPGCYGEMFYGCTSLIQAPELPATALASGCYTDMFRGCTSLTQAPELPATTLVTYCYEGMFRDCTSLTQVPELSVTTLTEACYRYMFRGCTSLTQAPELPATTLVIYCYQYMFYGCTSLTQAPELPATTLAPGCYGEMFYGCTSLTQAPELPATMLKTSCYMEMFRDCTSLTQAPELPATTLANYCYSYMFNGCIKIKISDTQTGDYQTAWRIPSSGSITSEPDGFGNKMLTGTGGTFTNNPSINTTYYGVW